MDHFVCQFHPIILDLPGVLAVRWYGLMYFLSFVAVVLLVNYQLEWRGWQVSKKSVNDLIFWLFLLMVVGARVGYFAFYDFSRALSDPVAVLRIWEGGMSFHGGLVGVVLGGWFLAKKYGLSRLQLADLLIWPSALSLALGRVGNLMNCEIWGRVADLSWAMIFPRAGELARHPAQIYGSILYFLVFVVLFILLKKKPQNGSLFFWGIFLLGMARFVNEFFREPDYLVWSWLTIGQALSLPLILVGMWGAYALKLKHGK